jgi:hypothetical protein
VIGHNIPYCLETDKNGSPILSYKLGLKILFENNETIKIDVGREIVTLKKAYYLNTHYRKDFIIHDTGEVFFALATKHVKAQYVFDRLMEYAIQKIDKRVDELKTHFESRIDKLENLKQDYKSRIKHPELEAA